ncbi:MAG: lipase family alpha/beta hydrolase [Burkholderiales bacterium]
MLARIAWVWHLVEWMLLCVLASWLVLGVGWTAIGAIASAVGIFCGWRIVGNAATLAVASRVNRKHSQSAQRSIPAFLRLAVREAWTFTRAYACHQLLPGVFGREGPADRAIGGRPIVLLVHGYFCNGGVWRYYVRWLEARGFAVFTVSMEPVYGSLEENSRVLEARIESILVAAGAQRLALVGHSMGGLVARAYLRRCGAERIDRIVTLGSPHQGTELAGIAYGENGRAMCIGSGWLTDPLNVQGLEQVRNGVTTIISRDDNLVAPYRNGTLSSARSIEIVGIGHLSMTASRTVFEIVASVLSDREPPISGFPA